MTTSTKWRGLRPFRRQGKEPLRRSPRQGIHHPDSNRALRHGPLVHDSAMDAGPAHRHGKEQGFLELDPGNDFTLMRRSWLRGGKTWLGLSAGVRAIYNIDQKFVELDQGWFAGKKELRTLQLGQWREVDPPVPADRLPHGQPNRGQWGAPMGVKKLYIRGGKLTSLRDEEGWEAKVLRLRFLNDLQYGTLR